jgi:hypothetical protein
MFVGGCLEHHHQFTVVIQQIVQLITQRHAREAAENIKQTSRSYVVTSMSIG